MTPTKILVVDDRPENLLTLEASLRSEQLTILQASSGEDALEKLLVHDVALAILDVQMPGMDGFELAELIRGAERTRHIPIIFLTAGAADQERIFRGYESGAVDFIFKPYDRRILISKVNVFVELYRHRQELNDALRFSDLFVGILGHDLRNPLSAIAQGAYLLQVKASDQKMANIAGLVLGSAKRMTRMIEEILDFTRLRMGGGITLNRKTNDLIQLTTTIVDELRLGSDGRISVESAGNATVVCDGDRIMQALSNLIGNALQHGTRDKPVAVLVDGSQPHEVSVEIRNHGTISSEILPYIFDPFKRAGVKTDRSRSGLGLGLYITQQIVNSHGGNISVSSDGETSFRVDLPRHSGYDNT